MNSAHRFAHLRALTDVHGVFEHALLDVPRREHGYCVDDVARALIVIVRDPELDVERAGWAETYLRFLESALDRDGLVRNRMDANGAWTDEPGMGDWWGRLIWALGTAAARAPDASFRARALRAFHQAAQQRSQMLHTAAFAALGAVEIAGAYPANRVARGILLDLVACFPSTPDAVWPWPEDRMRYANASLVEALVAAGGELGDDVVTERGLRLLAFLLATETTDGRLSVTGTAGRGREEVGPLFDQQPIEIAAIADACARAYTQTGDADWLSGIDLAWQWFRGVNDSSIPVFDSETGAGFDGLERDGRNQNRGAESTLAVLSTYQQARRFGLVADA